MYPIMRVLDHHLIHPLIPYMYIFSLLHKAAGFIIHLFCGTTGSSRTALELHILNVNSALFFALFLSVEAMRLLKIPEKRPQYRKDRHHENFLTSLSSHVRPDVKENRHVSTYYDNDFCCCY